MQKGEPMSDFIDRQAAIEHCKKRLYETALNNNLEIVSYTMQEIADNRIDIWLKELPSADPEFYGYRISHLEFVARVLQEGNISPEELTSAINDVSYIVSLVLKESRNAIDNILKDMEVKDA
jgi:CCR4-NOT transcriptional regulation complex NOT5 subunit